MPLSGTSVTTMKLATATRPSEASATMISPDRLSPIFAPAGDRSRPGLLAAPEIGGTVTRREALAPPETLAVLGALAPPGALADAGRAGVHFAEAGDARPRTLEETLLAPADPARAPPAAYDLALAEALPAAALVGRPPVDPARRCITQRSPACPAWQAFPACAARTIPAAPRCHRAPLRCAVAGCTSRHAQNAPGHLT